MKHLPNISLLLCVGLLLYPPKPLATPASKCRHLILVLLFQTAAVYFAALNPPPTYKVTSNPKVQQIMRVKSTLFIAGASVVNYIITLKLAQNNIAWKPSASSHATRTIHLAIALWTLLKFCDALVLLIQEESFSVNTTLSHCSIFFMLLRVEGALLYISAEFLQLNLQLQLLNRQLSRWHLLEAVIKLSWQHNNLLTTIESTSNICGPVIASSSFFCIMMLLDDLSNLMMIGEFQAKSDIYIWAVHALVAFLVNVICLANVGERLAATTRKTVQICQKMCENLHRALILSEKEELHRQYQLIAQESYHRNAKLHADGFFPVDHSMIIFIVFNVCNNLVAIYQFISKHSD